MDKKLNIAVIGSGIAGISASYLLQRAHQVTLFERRNRLGGHTNTVEIKSGPDKGLGVDTGFIVCNNRNYPTFHKFLHQLNIPVRSTDMSFGFYDETSGFSYAGTNLNGLFADRKNLLNPKFWHLLKEITRFSLLGLKQMKNLSEVHGQSLGEFLQHHRFSQAFIDQYLVPISCAIWSTSTHEMLEFPITIFLQFYNNHGLLNLTDRPQWQTVIHGSHSYLKKFKETFSGQIHLGIHIKGIERTPDGVIIHTPDGSAQSFDKVVFAVHADQVLPLLTNPTEMEKKLFGVWHYQSNTTHLHTDTSVLPKNTRAWASWNFYQEKNASGPHPVTVTYDMSRLQGIESPQRYLVSLNLKKKIDATKIIEEIHYKHPTFTLPALESRENILKISGENHSYFVGSYFGFGFHEDAIKSSAQMTSKYFNISL